MRLLISTIICLGVGFLAGVNVYGSDTSSKEDIHCLALNIYHESANEPLRGKIAVSYVVLNRVKSSKFPNTVCDVVFEGPHRPHWKDKYRQVPIKNMCQFSWYCDGKSDEVFDLDAYEDCFEIARRVLNEYGTERADDPSKGAMWYHADYVNPKWSNTLKRTTKIGRHIFYKQ